MAVELVLKNHNRYSANCRIKTIVGDDDSSAIASLRRLSPYSIIKWSDFNHVKKTFNSKLYDIKLNATLREYFSKMFALAINKNKMEEDNVKSALLNIVPHAFGDHSQCSLSCTRSEDGTHVYKYFKDGQPLSDEKLKKQLETILEPYVNCVAQLAPCASSQANESFNNTVCSKHPKSHFYGGSESHCYRVALAVCQKNMGYEFVVELNRKLKLSPGKLTAMYRKKKQIKSSKRSLQKKSIPYKKRRSQLKKTRSSRDYSKENKEGITYQSGCGYLSTGDLIDEVFIAGKNIIFSNDLKIVFVN